MAEKTAGRRSLAGIWGVWTLFAAGALLAGWMVVQADRELRADLLKQTRLVAQAVSFECAQSLTGTAADLDNLSYHRLKEQLIVLRSDDPQCRFVYLLGRKADGTVLFFVDSEPLLSKDYSPPGQPLPEATEAVRRMFDTRQALVEGPVTDRWGVWISALVPLVDPKTGAVPVVLGMDIDARVWNWDVAAKAALPVGLLLVLLISVTVLLFPVRPVHAAPRPVLRRLLLPLMTAVILLTGTAGMLLWQQDRQQMADKIAADLSDASGDLHTALAQQTDGLTAAVHLIAADATVQKALREGDADRLLATWQPVFTTLYRKNHITHFYFMDTNRVCLLRVHTPEKRGDRIERFTALEAERSGKTASGLELGPLGTFTLRAVQPVFEGGTLAGYVELGKEIEDTLQTLHTRSGNDLSVFIRKGCLNRQSWEEGMRLLGRDTDWNRLPRSVVIYSSLGRLPDAFIPVVERDAVNNPAHAEADCEIVSDGKNWRVSAAPLKDVSGQEVGTLLVMRNITAEKAAFTRLMVLSGTVSVVLLTLLLGFIYVLLHRIDVSITSQQSSLRESEYFFKESQRAAFIGSYKTDLTTGFWEASEVLDQIFGIDRDYIRNVQGWLEIVHPDDRALMAHYLSEEVIAKRQPFNKEYRIIRKSDGEIRWVHGLGKVTFDPEGHVLFLIGTIQDVTERKRIEEELQTIRKLKSVGTLAGGIAHDFNNILQGLFGNISLAKDELPREHPGYALLDDAEKSMNRAVRLTKQLLTFAKGGSPVKETVPLGELVEEIARFDLSGSNVNLVYRQAEDLWPALADKGQIQQVISNLTINARHAMPKGGHLTITLENADLSAAAIPDLRQGRYVKVTVRDEGAGIDPTVLDQIFDPYFTTKQTGSGLGLATVYSIIHKHGGHIGVVSELGKGTTFTFYLPAFLSPQRTEAKQPAAECQLAARPARILVMDDEGMVCTLVTKMLTRCGFAVTTAPGGQEAIDLYKQALEAGAPFDVVIMDLTIPGAIGGKEAIKDLLAMDPHVKAVVSSGYADDPVMANPARFGFKGVVAKPYTQKELLEVVRRVMQ
ncbi:MAG: ATP-binding protein [bacterium]